MSVNMNFDRWRKLTKRRQKAIAQNWNVQKDEGMHIADAVLKAFIEQYGSKKDIEIDDEIIRLRDGAGWAIGVQCFNEAGVKATPAKYMGIAVSRLHIDHIEDGVFFEWIPPRLSQRFPDKSSLNCL